MYEDLIAFTAARVDEDEAAAKRVEPGQAPNELRAMVTRDGGQPFLIIDSARVLREVEAKREILEEFRAAIKDYGEFDVVRINHLKRAVKALAAIYDGHPAYDGAWGKRERRDRPA